MSGPGREAVNRGLYNADNYADAADTIRRIGNCHEHRLEQVALGVAGRAVVAAKLALDLVEDATPAVLRAMVVQLTTPELRPAVPVVLGPTSAPAGPDTQPSKEAVGGLAAPAPPAPWADRVIGLVQLYGNACHEISGRYFDLAPNVRQLLNEIREALNDGAMAAMVAEIERSYRDSPGFRDGSL